MKIVATQTRLGSGKPWATERCEIVASDNDAHELAYHWYAEQRQKRQAMEALIAEAIEACNPSTAIAGAAMSQYMLEAGTFSS